MKRIPEVVTEADYATALGHHFSARGWECYPEMGSDLTLYHRPSDTLVGVEAKKDLTFKVLQQAWNHKHHFDAVLICTSGSAISRFWAPRICSHADIGLGVIVVSNVDPFSKQNKWTTTEVLLRAQRRRPGPRSRAAVVDLMCPEAQTYATPGSSGPQGFTTFRMLEVRLYRAAVAKGSPLTRDEVIAIATKRVRWDRIVDYFIRDVFGTLALDGDLVRVRAPWGTKAAGHSGIQWAPADPALAGSPDEVIMDPLGPKSGCQP